MIEIIASSDKSPGFPPPKYIVENLKGGSALMISMIFEAYSSGFIGHLLSARE